MRSRCKLKRKKYSINNKIEMYHTEYLKVLLEYFI